MRYKGCFLKIRCKTCMPADSHWFNKSKKEKQRITGNIQLKLTGTLQSISSTVIFKIFKLSRVWVLSAWCAVAERWVRASVSGSCSVTATRGEVAGGVGTHRRCLNSQVVSAPVSWQVASANCLFRCYNSHYFIEEFCLRSLSFFFFFFFLCLFENK